MKQFSFALDDLAEVDSCLEKFISLCPGEQTNLLVSVFTHWAKYEIIDELLHKIRAKLPTATVVGTTASGGIKDGELCLGQTVLTFMSFRDTTVRVFAYDGNEAIPQAAGIKFLRAAGEMENLRGVEILSTLGGFDAPAFFDEITTLPEDVAVFGGCADNHDFGTTTFIFTQDQILDGGLVALCFLSPSLKIHVESSFGWKPLGRPLKITAMEGKNILLEINNLPAGSIYEKYLKIRAGENFHREALEFPLLLERGGNSIARLPETCREDGALVFNADCYEGEYVRLTYGDPGEIAKNTQEMQENLRQMSPEAVLVFSCVTRRIFMKDDVRSELANYREIAPTAGLYTHGEFNRLSSGKVQILNMTLITVLLSEGEAPHPLETASVRRRFPRSMSLVQRLAHFSTVMALELEEASHQLSNMAKQDRLTKLLNHNEIEVLLRRYMQEYRGVLAAIMLDIDNFKDINGSYGHERGDQLLVDTAKAIMNVIRQTDAAGRWGGDEFLVVLPGANLSQAVAVAQRIAVKISQLELEEEKFVSACFGVAAVQKLEGATEFYRRLSENLAEAQQKGKNSMIVK